MSDVTPRKALYTHLRQQLSVLNQKLQRYRMQAQSMDRAHKRLLGRQESLESLVRMQHKAIVAAWDALDPHQAVRLIGEDPKRFAVLSELPDIIRCYESLRTRRTRRRDDRQEEDRQEEGFDFEGLDGIEED